MPFFLQQIFEELRQDPWGTPYNGLYGEAPPERGTFSRLQVYKKGRGISLVEEYMGKDGPENLSFRSVKRPKRDNRYILWLLKRRENVLDLCWVLSVSYLCLAKLIFT